MVISLQTGLRQPTNFTCPVLSSSSLHTCFIPYHWICFMYHLIWLICFMYTNLIFICLYSSSPPLFNQSQYELTCICAPQACLSSYRCHLYKHGTFLSGSSVFSQNLSIFHLTNSSNLTISYYTTFQTFPGFIFLVPLLSSYCFYKWL